MKKMALFLLLLFTTVQVLPGIKGLFSDHMNAVVFNPDEEKTGEKANECKKDSKEYPAYQQLAALFSLKINTAFQLSAIILPAPSLEKLTPPPNC
jgi:hypothetical protein